MHFRRTLVKRIEVVVFFLAFVLGIYLFFFPARYFIAWHALPAPPQQITKIIATNHMGDVAIETISNEKFLCNVDHEKACWIKLDDNYRPFNLGKTLCWEDCPDTHTVQMMKSSYEFLIFARPSILYSLHDDGMIYIKHTGVIFWPGYVMGAIFGAFWAFMVYLSKRIWRRPAV